MPPRFRAPKLGFSPTTPQKLAGRRIEPPTWLPIATMAMPAATAAAEPEEEPPGVRAGSCGLVVGPATMSANSVVTALPTMTAPARRRAWAAAASRPVDVPAKIGEPKPVGMSAVSMMSLSAIGMPSMGDSGVPARQRAVAASAAAWAFGFKAAKARTVGSRAAMLARQVSSRWRGEPMPSAKPWASVA
jgi:hypothetical protein